MGYYVFVFFVKQKTAYEMRISDWSSDVCSSDLLDRADVHEHVFAAVIANDEAKTLLSIEEFYNAFAFTDDLRGHSAPAASASAASGTAAEPPAIPAPTATTEITETPAEHPPITKAPSKPPHTPLRINAILFLPQHLHQ